MHPARFLTALLIFAASVSAAAEKQSSPGPKDGVGNPLPPGAVARLGSTRWRFTDQPGNIVLSPDGRIIAVPTFSNKTEIIDAKTGKRLHSLGSTYPFGLGLRYLAAFSSDSSMIAYVAASGSVPTLRIRNLRDQRERSIRFRTKDDYKPSLPADLKKETLTTERGEYISALAFSPDGKVVAAAVRFHIKICDEKEKVLREEDENVVRRWEVATGKELRACASHKRTISALFFSADGKELTTASEDGSVRFWDTATGKEHRRCWKADGPLFCAAYSPDGKWLAAGSKKAVLLWDAATGELRHRLPMPAEEVWSIAFAPDGKLLAAGAGIALRLWEPGTAKLVREKTDFPFPIMALAFSADGKELLLVQQRERIIRRLQATTLKPSGELNGHALPVDILVFTADKKRLLTASRFASNEFCCWDAFTGKPCSSRAEDKKRIEGGWLAASVDGRNVLRLSQRSNGVVSSTYTSITITVESPGSAEISGFPVAVSADGKRLLLLHPQDDKRSTLIVLDEEKKLRELPQKDDKFSATLSPDGRTLAMVSAGQLTFLDVDSGRKRRCAFTTRRSLPLHSSALKFSPDGSRIAYLDESMEARIVSVRDGRLLNVIRPKDPDFILGLAFSADGKLCVCDRDNYPASLCEVATGEPIRSVKGSSCLLSPDNRLLAIQNEGALYLHDLYSGKMFRTCRDAAGFADEGNYAFSPDGKRLASAREDTTVLLWDTTVPEKAEKISPLDEKTLETLWKKLEAREAPAAYEAMSRIIADPQRTLPFLRKRLRKVPPVEEKRLRQWIADLESDSFAKREAASQELGRLGPLAEPKLRAALAQPSSLEMRLRIKNLLQPLEGGEIRLAAEELAHVRAIQVLERIGTAEARQVLKHLAEGAEGVARTRDAQEALLRLTGRKR